MKKNDKKDYMKQFAVSDDDLNEVVAGLGVQITSSSLFTPTMNISNMICLKNQPITDKICDKFSARATTYENPFHPCANCKFCRVENINTFGIE